ncbi:MAG: BREX system P-loop protein BrxC [Candidatus Omnitrophica bacterium]|nr:BREX system P-loop protein BrxC [Candidatus Omnitrophota bacterium]
MKIKELFTKDIFRPINGVIKAEQQDPASIWQELDELVLTKELTGHLDKFFSVYSDTVDNASRSDASGKVGVWVSGFFGSGKSHFIKALHYLFSNTEAEKEGVHKKAIQFFEEKITDAMLSGTVKRIAGKDTDAILFNIDRKAGQSKGRDAILAVFLKVLNDLQGYCPDHPHIAHMERYLDDKGQFEEFKNKYSALTGEDWIDRRIDWQFNQDEIIRVLAQILGQSEEASRRWIDHAETDFSMTVENFSKWVKEYLDKQSSKHRIFFFVDEIGQFVGSDGHLMLNLQTIVENLGVTCEGRAWVVVTSQEDIDKVLGSLSNARTNDFSKIQGRFKTRLSLSSSNTDEVIQKRLLAKKENCHKELTGMYQPKADILKNQLMFTTDTGMTLSSYKDAQDFINTYPFIPYQFKLLQKVFETIRRAGATGLHLSRGERSMLDAFQFAAQQAASKETGILVPLHWFYPSIESFLDTAVKRTIDQAKQNPSLHEFDIFILQTLFMIRYIDEVKGNIDNLVTLRIESIDEDRFDLRTKIEQSLLRLEKETLIARSGENFYFLTNEEQDISREIKNVELGFGDESRALNKIIFEDIYRDEKKHRYAKTGKDFDVLHMCDLQVFGGRVEKGLTWSIISPFHDEYSLYGQARCIGESTNDNGCIIIKLSDNEQLGKEIKVFLKTDKYIARKNDGNEEIKRILNDRKSENRDRKTRLIELVKSLLSEAEFYINGQVWKDGSEDVLPVRVRALDYLIDNTFPKMGYIEHPCVNPQAEVQSVLRYDDTAQRTFDMNVPENNPCAAKDVREYISLCAMQSKQMVMYEIIERYGLRPFGWNEWETALLLVKLFCLGEIQFVLNGGIVERNRAYEVISRTSNWKKITIRRRKVVDSSNIEEARKLGQQIFGEMGPDKEVQLFEFLKNKCEDLSIKLSQYKTLAETGKYPGLDDINELLRLASILINSNDSFDFIARFLENKEDLTDAANSFADIEAFYTKQRMQWDELRDAVGRFELNRFDLEKDTNAKSSLIRMKDILQASAPYESIQEAAKLIQAVGDINNKLLKDAREFARKSIFEVMGQFEKEAKSMKAAKEDIENAVDKFKRLSERADNEPSAANIRRLIDESKNLFEEELNRIAQSITGTKEKPQIKEIKTFHVKSIAKKSFLETEDDVDEFCGDLSRELKTSIKEGKRLKIE